MVFTLIACHRIAGGSSIQSIDRAAVIAELGQVLLDRGDGWIRSGNSRVNALIIIVRLHIRIVAGVVGVRVIVVGVVREVVPRIESVIEADPRNYIAQPVITLSTAPTLTDDGLEPRHLDLRPFILSRDEPYVTTGGLTRVALVKGSLVVNSSQGGGSKDTWVVDVEDGP